MLSLVLNASYKQDSFKAHFYVPTPTKMRQNMPNNIFVVAVETHLGTCVQED